MIGIVAEYNPFHEGHKYHIKNTTDGCTVVVMSGDFVQRGEPAIFDKFSRAKQAVLNGANLVVELPLPWCLSSAETFAFGGVKILESLGVDKISFGSECGDIDKLYETAKKVSDSLDSIKKTLKEDQTLTFPEARSKVVNSDILNYPNNSLGIEYIKAASVPCITIKRYTDHDGLMSAKSIRDEMKLLGIGVSYLNLETAILSRLRMFDLDYYLSLPDSENGVGNRLYYAVRKSNTLHEVYENTKTKSITMSAVRRLTMCAALGVKKEMNKGIPPYIRILAFDDVGKNVLKNKATFSIPVITNPKEVFRFSENIQKLYAVGASAHDLYRLGMNRSEPKYCGEDYRNGPIIV